MARATAYILLAAFLRLQATSCSHEELCLCSPDPALAARVASSPSSCGCGHGHARCDDASSDQDPGARDLSPQKDPRSGRHLCVIAHLRFLGSRAAAPINFLLAVNSFDSTSGVFDVWSTTTFDPGPSVATARSSLLECGSLLRV